MLVDMERDGKKYKVIVPDDAEEEMYQYGVVVGPPDFNWLPPSVDVRLHNELYNRGIITALDAQKRGHEIVAALQSALKVDVHTIQAHYLESK